MRPFLRELGLLVADGGVERPSIAAILLFGREPQRFLPHAIVTVTIDTKKRKVITGNLLQQRRDLLEWAEQKEVNPTLKVKVRDRHEERQPTPSGRSSNSASIYSFTATTPTSAPPRSGPDERPNSFLNPGRYRKV